MNILKSIKPVSITFVLIIFSTVAFGQKLAPKNRKTEPDHTIFSKIRGRD